MLLIKCKAEVGWGVGVVDRAVHGEGMRVAGGAENAAVDAEGVEDRGGFCGVAEQLCGVEYAVLGAACEQEAVARVKLCRGGEDRHAFIALKDAALRQIRGAKRCIFVGGEPLERHAAGGGIDRQAVERGRGPVTDARVEIKERRLTRHKERAVIAEGIQPCVRTVQKERGESLPAVALVGRDGINVRDRLVPILAREKVECGGNASVDEYAVCVVGRKDPSEKEVKKFVAVAERLPKEGAKRGDMLCRRRTGSSPLHGEGWEAPYPPHGQGSARRDASL